MKHEEIAAPWRMRWVAVCYGVTVVVVTAFVWSTYAMSDPAERGANIGAGMMWALVTLPTFPVWVLLGVVRSALPDTGVVAFACCYAAGQVLLVYWWARRIDRKLAAAAAGPPARVSPWLTVQIVVFAAPAALCPLLLWWVIDTMCDSL